MLEAVLFDFDGTLVDFVAADLHSLRRLHAHVGATVCLDEFLETAVEEIMKFHALVAEKQIDPLTMHSFRLRNTFARHGLAWQDRYVGWYQKTLLEAGLPFPGVEKLLGEVRQKAKTGLITNAYDGEEQRQRIQRAGLEAYFDTIVVACDIGLYKPDPAIFLHTLERLQVAPGNALYVGDSVAHDISGAKAAGMKTVLFSPHAPRETPLADYCVQGIAALQALLEHILP